jgi:hypothetical protein
VLHSFKNGSSLPVTNVMKEHHNFHCLS